jgi:hypothetical protein
VARLEPQLDDRANGLLVPAPQTVAPGDVSAPAAQPVVEQIEG